MLKLLVCFNLIFLPLAFADVYPDTVNQRRALTTEEKQHLLHLGVFGKGGCSASALTPDTLITAEHCLARYPDGTTDTELSQGYFELDPTQTFRVMLVLDASSHYANDLLILKIRWNSGQSPALLRYTREIIIHENQLKFGEDAQATKLFSIGYPRDLQKRGTYSEGYLKSQELPSIPEKLMDPYSNRHFTQAVFLKVNVPLTNGNSGGPVFTENYKLVGTVHGGSDHTDAEKEMGNYTSQDPSFWNRIAPIYHLYSEMKTLQKLYPNGINPNVSETGEWLAPQEVPSTNQ